jgi:hypothetical protein
MRHLGWVCAAALLSLACAARAACGDDLAGAQRVESGRYTVAYRAVPAPTVGNHFALELAVCPRGGAPAAESLGVDARMPEHGHGMNYRAAVKRLGADRFRAEGLMFHMPGRWQLVIDVRSGQTSERLTHDIVLR